MIQKLVTTAHTSLGVITRAMHYSL